MALKKSGRELRELDHQEDFRGQILDLPNSQCSFGDHPLVGYDLRQWEEGASAYNRRMLMEAGVDVDKLFPRSSESRAA